MMTTAALALLLVKTPVGLKPADMIELRKTKQTIYLPTWLPAGFKGDVGVNVEKDPIMTSYGIEYSNGKGSSFVIQTASEGIGDIFLETKDGEQLEEVYVKVKTPYWGTQELAIDKKTRRQWVLNWQENKGKSLPTFVGLFGSNMALADVKRIIASIQKFK